MSINTERFVDLPSLAYAPRLGLFPAAGAAIATIPNREMRTLPIKKKLNVSERFIEHICCYLGGNSMQMESFKTDSTAG